MADSWWTTPVSTAPVEGRTDLIGGLKRIGELSAPLMGLQNVAAQQPAQEQAQSALQLPKPGDVLPGVVSGYRAMQEAAAKQLSQDEGVPPMLARPDEQAAPSMQQQAMQAAQARYAPAQPVTPADAFKAAQARYAGTPVGLAAEELGLQKEAALADLGTERAGMGYDIAAQERYNQSAAKAEQVDAEQQARWERMRTEFDQAQAKRLRDMEELKTEIAATKIDPQNYWAKGSGFGQALSLLAVALGGFAEGYSGGRLKNTALDQLNRNIDQDIEAQKANLATKRGALAESQNIYGLARQKFGDDQSAMDYTRARQNEALKNASLRFAGEARTEKLKLAAQNAAAHFGNQEKLYDLKVRQLYADADAARLRAAAGAQAAAQAAVEREIDKRIEREKKIAEVANLKAQGIKLGAEAEKLAMESGFGTGRPEVLTPKVAERIVNFQERRMLPSGQVSVVPKYYDVPESKSKEAVDRVAAADEFSRQMETLVQLNDKTGIGYGLGAGELSKKIDATHKAAATALMLARGGKSDNDYKQAEESIPKPARIFDSGERATLLATKDLARFSAQSYLNAIARPVSVETKTLANGQTMQVVVPQYGEQQTGETRPIYRTPK